VRVVFADLRILHAPVRRRKNPGLSGLRGRLGEDRDLLVQRKGEGRGLPVGRFDVRGRIPPFTVQLIVKGSRRSPGARDQPLEYAWRERAPSPPPTSRRKSLQGYRRQAGEAGKTLEYPR
jgi:hypothetical protein